MSFQTSYGLSGAWQNFTPAVTSSAGAITTSTVNSAQFCRLGSQTILWELDFTITTAGAGAGGFLIFNLPVSAAGVVSHTNIGMGRETNATGNSMTATINTTVATAIIAGHANGTSVTSGWRINVSGMYKRA